MRFLCYPYKPLRITSGYGDRTEQVKNIPGATKWHDGVDIGRDANKFSDWKKPCGEVYAVAGGVVTESGYNRARGWYVKIQHPHYKGKLAETFYQHLYGAGAKVGKKVRAGDVIGLMGNSGVSSAPHLHFEVRLNRICNDPVPFLKTVGDYTEKELKLKKRFYFSDGTMFHILRYEYADAVVDGWLQEEPKQIDDRTRKYMLSYEYGEELLRRVYNGKH